MTSLAIAASVYTRAALRLGEVLPVRAPERVAERGTDRQRGAEFAARGQGEQQPHARVSRSAPLNVVELPVVKREPVPPAAATRTAQPFAPFLAQQIAQEGLPDRTAEAARQRKHAAVSDAYILASDDAANILGPVRPRQLVV